MARDHLIPAVLLGQFAIPDDFAKRPRERGIYASTNHNRTTERRRVDKIGYGRRFYDHAPLPSGIVAGATWNAYEDRISAAIEELAGSGAIPLIDSWTWLKVLLPLVAGLYVRGPDFVPSKRVTELDNEHRKLMPISDSDNMAAARVPEHIRLMAPLMGADWTIVTRAANTKPFLISDLGYQLTANGYRPDGSMNVNGITVPLTPNLALRVDRRPPGARAIAVALNGRWVTPMNTQMLSANEVNGFNQSMCRNALSFVAGSTPDLSGIDISQFAAGRHPPDNSSHKMWGTDAELTLNGIEWFNARKELSHPPDDVVCVQLVRSRKYNASCVEPPGWEPAVVPMPGAHMGSLGHSGIERWGCVIKYDPYARIFGRLAGDWLFGPRQLPESLRALKLGQILCNRT